MKCSNCGQPIPDGARFCGNCGAIVLAVGQPSTPVATETSDKSFLVTALLSYLLGLFGADRFYLGEIGLGVAKLLTFGGLGIWAFIDIILILAGVTKDKQGRPLEGRDEALRPVLIAFGCVTAANVIFYVIYVIYILQHVNNLLPQPS